MTATPLPPAGTELVKAARDSSFSERKAMEIEREVMDLYRAFFMRDRVGDKFPGTITAVTGFGLFVSIDEPFVEGLVRTEELGQDSFELDDVAMRLRGRRSGRMFALGDRIEVEILSVSVPRRRIELRLVGAPARAPGVPAGGWRDRARERSGGRARAAKHEARPADARRGGSASAARPAAKTASGGPGEPRGRQDKAADRRAPRPARDTARGGASKPGRAAGGRPGGKPAGGGKRGRRR
jgi:ribonuclease R